MQLEKKVTEFGNAEQIFSNEVLPIDTVLKSVSRQMGSMIRRDFTEQAQCFDNTVGQIDRSVKAIQQLTHAVSGEGDHVDGIDRIIRYFVRYDETDVEAIIFTPPCQDYLEAAADLLEAGWVATLRPVFDELLATHFTGNEALTKILKLIDQNKMDLYGGKLPRMEALIQDILKNSKALFSALQMIDGNSIECAELGERQIVLERLSRMLNTFLMEHFRTGAGS